MPPTPTVLFVATKMTPGVVNIRSALQKFGYPFQQIGLNQRWTGWRFRMQLYVDVCKNFREDQLLLLVDADDVLPVLGPETLYGQFKAFGKSVVVSSELLCGPTCTPIESYWKIYPDVETKRRYVCCGLMAGYAKELVELWQAMLDSGLDDDQVALGYQIRARPFDFAVDYENKLFYTVPPTFVGITLDIRFDEDHQFEILSENGHEYRPYFIHYAGNFYLPQIKRNLIGSGHVDVYDDVARHVSGDSAMCYYQGNDQGQLFAAIVVWILIALLFVTIIALIVVSIRRTNVSKEGSPKPTTKGK